MYGMNILITCLFMYNATGSEMYFSELAKALTKLGHDVTVTTKHCSNYFSKESQDFNYKIVNPLSIDENTANKKFDLVLISHANIMFKYLSDFKFHRHTKYINIVHSEIYPDEHPIVEPFINKYIAIRKPIQDMLINDFNIPKSKTEIIYNPIDTNRFNTIDTTDENFGLFIGSLNELRLPSCLDFNVYCKERGLKSIYIGSGNNQAQGYDEKLEPVWDIENYIKKASICGGIIHGRTYWEAKLCGKETMEYIIDSSGKIIDRIYENKPDQIELDQVYSKVSSECVAQSMIDSVFSSI